MQPQVPVIARHAWPSALAAQSPATLQPQRFAVALHEAPFGFVAQSAFVTHSTQRPFVVSQTGNVGFVQSVLAAQAGPHTPCAQTLPEGQSVRVLHPHLPAVQTAPVPASAQSAALTHWTHIDVFASQAGAEPGQSVPASQPQVSFTHALPTVDREQSPRTTHWTHPAVLGSQTSTESQSASSMQPQCPLMQRSPGRLVALQS
jgi:hypothetical protein